MGVNRLWSYIKKKKRSLVTYVDLVEIAKGYPDGIKILVDFYSWEHFMVKHFWMSLTRATENENIIFAGGEYRMMDIFIKEFIEQLRAVKIELVFFLDGAKGSATASSKQKLRTWQIRFHEDQNRLRKTADYLRGMEALSNLDLDHLTRPCLQEVQNVMTLQECGCIIHLQVSGEADHVIAKHMQNDASAFAVLSNDTDFCIFEKSVLMPFDYFDMDGDLGLGLESLSVKQPDKLKCGIVQTETIITLLDLPDHESLIEFAVICGNDFTCPYLSENPVFRFSYQGQMDKLADMIRRNRVAEECTFFGPAIARDPELREAVEHSRQFYSLTLAEEEEKETGVIYNLIADGIRMGKLPSTLVAMYRGMYWHRQVLEDPSPGLITTELALTVLRTYIYAILLPNHRMSVMEIGRTPFDPVKEITVRKVNNPRIPNFVKIKSNTFHQNLRIFEYIIQHQESPELNPGENPEQSYFKLYGLRTGFVCFLLRYFLLMNWGQNLYITAQEFFVLVAWTLGKHETSYHHLKIRPSPRCVTVENWFLALYRNAYAFLGNILNLSHEFPAPRELFSGGTWVALYTASLVFDLCPHFREPPPLRVPMEDLRSINMHLRDIIVSNREIVKNIIKGLFPFE